MYILHSICVTLIMATQAKTQTVENISEKTGFTKKDTGIFYDSFLKDILDTMGNGDKFFMRGVGSFEIYIRKATRRRNPLTGEIVEVPEKKAIRFIPGKLLKAAIEG